MSTLAKLAAELRPWFPQIDPLSSPTLVQRAYQDIRKSREWSFLKQNGVWFCPSIITTGTVKTTFLSDRVIVDAFATPFWQAVALTPPPEQPLTMRQFRVTGGPIYNIIGWTPDTPVAGLSEAQLDRPYTEGSNNSSTYMVYQPYAQAPVVDFKRWTSWVDPLNNYHFRYNNLYRTKEELDRHDPIRQSYSIPIMIASHDYVLAPGDVEQRPRFELWPHPVQQIGYVTEYQIQGDYVAMTDYLPRQITDQCVMARARHYGHELVANQPNVDVKVKSYHLAAQRRADAEYVDLLNRCQLDDNMINDKMVQNSRTGPALSGPYDASYLQNHEIFLVP